MILMEFLERNKLIYNAYFSNTYIDALKQILYITQNIYKKINIKFNNNKNIININEKFIYKIIIPKKLKKQFYKKINKIYYDYLLYFNSKNEKLQLTYTITV